MAICTYSDIFDFIGAESDVINTQKAFVTSLISNVEEYVQSLIGRKITPYTVTDLILADGLNCEIYGRNLYLKGIYRDIYTISQIYENGELLTAVSSYSGGGDYFLDAVAGKIVRRDVDWSLEQFAIKLSGSACLGGTTTPYVIKQAVIELVAAKSGLWKQNVLTEGGDITKIRTTASKETIDQLKYYVMRNC